MHADTVIPMSLLDDKAFTGLSVIFCFVFVVVLCVCVSIAFVYCN